MPAFISAIAGMLILIAISMLITKVISGENIDRAIKRYRNKVRKTLQIKQLRENQQFTKKSQVKREQKAKAIYREEYLRSQEM